MTFPPNGRRTTALQHVPVAPKGDPTAIFEASQVTIKFNMEPLESTSTLPYLGRTIVYNNPDWAALYQYMSKAQRH